MVEFRTNFPLSGHKLILKYGLTSPSVQEAQTRNHMQVNYNNFVTLLALPHTTNELTYLAMIADKLCDVLIDTTDHVHIQVFDDMNRPCYSVELEY